MLTVDALSKRFGGLRAVDDVSLSVEPGELVAIIGPNGAGKSTLFHLISGFVDSDSGSVEFDGKAIERAAPYRIARQGLVRTFQVPKIFERLSVIDNLKVAASEQPDGLLGTFSLGHRRRREAEISLRATELLGRFELDHMADRYAGTLSGGQRKLLELARALMVQPRMLLLDEPMAGVNPALSERLLAQIAALRDSDGVTVLFIEHNMQAVATLAERVIVLAEGALLASGTPEQVRSDPRVIDAYLGVDSDA